MGAILKTLDARFVQIYEAARPSGWCMSNAGV